AKMLMTGSYNFTNDSEYRNYEAALFTNSKPLIQTFTTEFERLWLLPSVPSLPATPSPTFGGKGDYGGKGAINKN
ncbi:MAG: phospholipase D-like domain-containing protein, partial [Deltaproteobacteria bacterium]|nr:phospholipase D-like domain-containing protein [Deltaproteobacteria bacterium]